MMASCNVQRDLEAWFAARDWQVFDFQRQTWAACAAGESGLIHAATGTGKTLAAWGGALVRSARAEAPDPPLKVLWITPLRALAADTVANLQAPLQALGLSWQVQARTGDTSQSVRKRQRQRLPATLVTTPESLSLLLSYRDNAQQFADLDTVVVDEWHELLGSKRGVQLELCLAALRGLRPGLVTWGLSATIGNMQQARDVLLGAGASGLMIQGFAGEEAAIEAVIPERMARFPWAGHLGVKLLPAVISAVNNARSTLLFTNTRSQAELWYQAIIDAGPPWAERVALHHGSIDRALRDAAEAGLRSGDLRCVVATSSLDLGVDFSPVDQVICVGSPKGVARLLQRAGRSGHGPGRRSQVLCVPTHAFELVEIAAARRSAAAGVIEARRPLSNCLDVLVQHLVTRALGGAVDSETLYREALCTWAFAELDQIAWSWVVDFVTRGGDALQAYPHFRRVTAQDGRLVVTDTTIARRHRMSVGTITSDSAMQVRWLKGGRVGRIEESFISRLKPRDKFLFSGRLLQLLRVRDMTAYVRLARSGASAVPRWMGGRMPLSSELAGAVRALLDGGDANDSEPEMRAVRDVLATQADMSRLPAQGQLLIEHITSREGHHLFVYPFAGRLVHEGLGALLAYRLTRQQPATFTVAANDYGFELLTPAPPPIDEPELRAALSTAHLFDDLAACVNVTEMARHQFRDIARISGLVFQGFPGRGKSVRQVQASSGLVFDVLTRYDRHSLLVAQAHREVFESQMEVTRLREALAGIGEMTLTMTEPARLTPLAFPLWAERTRSKVSSEDWRDRVARMSVRLEAATA